MREHVGFAGAAAIAVLGASSLVAAPPRVASAVDTEPDAGPNVHQVELGRRLFFDPAISRSGDTSCASCHDPEHGFSSPEARAEDDFLPSKRHAPTLVDLSGQHRFNWDGRSPTMDVLIWARLAEPSPARYRMAPFLVPPPPDGGRMALGVSTAVVRDGFGRLRLLDVETLPPVGDPVEADGRYASQFLRAYGTASVSSPRLVGALTAFVRSIRRTESPFDRFAAGDEQALTAPAKRGHDLFFGRARCGTCHVSCGGPSPFTDGEFHNVGVEWASKARGDASSRTEVGSASRGSDPDLWRPAKGHKGHVPVGGELVTDGRQDFGRRLFDGSQRAVRAFKTPTLRDVARRGPYMHDGSIETLEDVVRFFAGGGAPDPRLDPAIRPFAASAGDVADLVAFLRSLSGDERPAGARDYAGRAARTRARVVDARGRPLAGLRIALVPAGDVLPGDSPAASPPREARTDDRGRFEYTPPRRTHVRAVLPDGLRAVQGEMIPDTCERLTLVVPVRGRARILVHWPAGRAAPARLSAEAVPPAEKRPAADVIDPPWSRLAKRVPFVLDGLADVEGVRLARYTAWVHADAPEVAFLEAPGPEGKHSVEVSLEDGAETRIDLTTR
jgi:cytochrome c peroxidase